MVALPSPSRFLEVGFPESRLLPVIFWVSGETIPGLFVFVPHKNVENWNRHYSLEQTEIRMNSR